MNDTRQSGNSYRHSDECKCVVRDNDTQNSINAAKTKVCSDLYDAASQVSTLEQRFKGEKEIFKEKKCLFTKTEANYQRYRNFDMIVGTELLQTNDSVKTSVAGYLKLNKDLGTALKSIAQSVKNVKTKFADLLDASCKLESCLNDSCNTSQRKAITGHAPGCDGEPIDVCKDAETIIWELICRPKGLTKDIDSIFKSSYDVVGIQKFTNIDSLDPMQTTLSENAKSLAKHINDAMKTRKTDLDNLQGEIVKSVQSITKAALDRNQQRSNFEGYLDATSFICCSPCKCVVPLNTSDCGNDMKKLCEQSGKPMLATCEKMICDICEIVQKAFCCPETPPPPPPGKQGC